jgi:8-oxo-dGTP diphosphatase
MNVQFKPPVASITVDCVIFGFNEKKLQVLLIKRSSVPEKGKWALPGGFMELNETSDQAANRVLEQLTGVTNIYMDQVRLYSGVKRHPMARVVTIGYYALINPALYNLKPNIHASDARWFDLDEVPEFPFDHAEIFRDALAFLKRDIRLKPIGFKLLPKKFTLSELQELYEAILDESLDRRNFRKKIKNLDILKELDEVRKGRHKDAFLYKFDKAAYEKFLKRGFELLI